MESERMRALEAAFERERQQRDLLEKKYARLKRRYIRLERSHARLVMESHGKRNEGSDTPTDPSNIPGSFQSTPSPHTSTSVIDLTSPHSSSTSARRSNQRSVEDVSRRLRSSQEEMFSTRDDICAESPSSSTGSPDMLPRRTRSTEDQEEKEETGARWHHSTERPTSSTPEARRRLHLDFRLPPSFTEGYPAFSTSLQRPLQHTVPSDRSTSPHSSPQSTPSRITHSFGEPRTRTRPRLRLHHSPERTAARAYGYELEQELEPRTHRHERYRWASEPSPEPTVSLPVISSSVPTVPSPISRPTGSIQSDEEASLALARYLQQQENIAAFEEYEARLHEPMQQEYNQPSSGLSGVVSHLHSIDPDNMSYEELLRLGEEVGDVKKERWRRMAIQVLSSLPTHRWTHDHDEDISCIICQYNFVSNDRAMTLPCAHVFHEDCVGGWIRENNSCPLCKREITPV